MAVDAHAVAQHALKRVTAARSEVWYPTTSVGDVTLQIGPRTGCVCTCERPA